VKSLKRSEIFSVHSELTMVRERITAKPADTTPIVPGKEDKKAR
jgi:hypothetical protein